jgi:hypothetical protein
VLQIPEGALLQQVTINGTKQTIGQEGQAVRVPVEPGAQTIELSWRETHELGPALHGAGGRPRGAGGQRRGAHAVPAEPLDLATSAGRAGAGGAVLVAS